MTPELQAMKLVIGMKEYACHSRDMTLTPRENKIEAGKQCALIAVDMQIQILESLAKPEYVAFILKDELTFETEYETHFHGYDLIEYWQQVKIEIEKI